MQRVLRPLAAPPFCPPAAGDGDAAGRCTMLCRSTSPATLATINLCSTISRCNPHRPFFAVARLLPASRTPLVIWGEKEKLKIKKKEYTIRR
jgi:hypothetical protein